MNGDFLNTDISQGSVATRLGCGGAFVYDFVTKFPTESNSERILEIGQYLKLWARVRCLVFLTHGVEHMHALYRDKKTDTIKALQETNKVQTTYRPMHLCVKNLYT